MPGTPPWWPSSLSISAAASWMAVRMMGLSGWSARAVLRSCTRLASRPQHRHERSDARYTEGNRVSAARPDLPEWEGPDLLRSPTRVLYFSTFINRQPRLNLRPPLLSPSDLPVRPLSPRLVHAHRNLQLVLVRRDLLPA